MRTGALREGFGRVGDPAVEQAPGRAQPPHAHAQLVHVFGRAGAIDAQGVHLGQHGGVARDVVHAFGRYRRHGLHGGHRLVQLDRAGVARRPEAGDGLLVARCPRGVIGLARRGGQVVRQLRQRIAPFGFAARIQHQPVALQPAARHGEDGRGPARNQFELQFGDRQFERAGAQHARVVGQLDGAMPAAHLAEQPLHVGFVAQPQLALDGRQRGLRLGAGVDGQVQHRPGARVVDLHAADGIGARHLQRLHPVAPFLAQPDRDAGARQLAAGGVEIHGVQADARGLPLLDLLLHRRPRRRRDVQLQFLF